MATEKREETRNKVYAKVISMKDNTPGYLRDLSKSGCQISFIKPIKVEKGDALTLHIIPGEEIGIADFKIFLEILWTHFDSFYFSVGGRVSPLPGAENQQQLNNLYAYYTELNSK